jgi:hypothetical protein
MLRLTKHIEPGSTAMLAEIYMLQLEARARAAKEAVNRSTSQFVAIPPVVPTSPPSH